MIKKIKLIPVTETSHPFAHAVGKCRLASHSYAEDEFFLYGTANVYEEKDGKPAVIFPDAPYVNRMLVRRPQKPENFSGNVVIEILNPSALYDIDRMWAEAWRYFVRHGDIYIGITAKSDVLDTLYRIDPERYKEISWKNPLPGRPLPENKGRFPILAEYENGIFWDMLTDLSKALREDCPVNPIAGFGKPYVYLTGWSQCGGFMTRYRNTFADIASAEMGRPVFDGYLQAGSGAQPAPINSFAPRGNFWENAPDFDGYITSSEPYIVLNTETETPHTRWAGDSDRPDRKFRVYEISGSSHDSKYNLLDYYEEDDDPAKVGRDQPYYGLEEYPIDYPYEYVFSAAFRNLFVWVREGVPAPASKKLMRTLDGDSMKDAFGNTLGGVRTPFLDLPTARYSKYCTWKEDPSVQRDFWGHTEPFSPEMLKGLYGTLENYRDLVAHRTDELIAEGYLLECEREDLIEQASQFAHERGLN